MAKWNLLTYQPLNKRVQKASPERVWKRRLVGASCGCFSCNWTPGSDIEKIE